MTSLLGRAIWQAVHLAALCRAIERGITAGIVQATSR